MTLRKYMLGNALMEHYLLFRDKEHMGANESHTREIDGHVGFRQFEMYPNGDVRPCFRVSGFLLGANETAILTVFGTNPDSHNEIVSLANQMATLYAEKKPVAFYAVGSPVDRMAQILFDEDSAASSMISALTEKIGGYMECDESNRDDGEKSYFCGALLLHLGRLLGS